ncbi:MAG: S-layer homology domain-containing protein, partial [Bacillota bacterium]|nr:S-layer homology domain-containing protein [Bacillota bacterium]
MKRIVVLALIALLLSSLAFASFAEDSTALYELVGEKLKHVGIITGDTSGNLKVAGTVTREQAIVILLRMMGKRAEAEAYPKQQVFTDVPSTHWAASYIAYAKNAGLTNGVGNNRFGLGNSVTGIQMASFMLRALGYQATWGVDDIMKMAADQGLMHEVNVQAKDVMIRGKTFVMMRNTLRSKAKGSEEIYAKTIGITEEYFLVDSKPVGPQDPVSPSTPKPTTPALKPVKITKQVPIPVRTSTYNYEELSVYFNIPIATPKPENFKVTVE